MNETWKPPSLVETVEGFKKSPQFGINLEFLAEGIKNGELKPEKLASLNETFVTCYKRRKRFYQVHD